MPYYTSVLQPVLTYIRERTLLRAGDRVAVAVSGGADSVALLRLLLELRADLGIVLAVAHFNHGLRGEQSAADQAFVEELAKELELEFHVGHGDVGEHARNSKLSIETAGRELRYRWLATLAREQRLDAIATAHTLDDQAETVLLKLLRGAGTRGLAGVYPVVANDEATRLVRPLLCTSRNEVESYLTALGQSWREDESNRDRRFLRNRVRHELLPLLEREFNPNIRGVLNDLAEVSRAEEQYWHEKVARELAERTGSSSNAEALDFANDGNAQTGKLVLDGFANLPTALQRRLLKGFAERHRLTLDFAHIERLRSCAVGECPRVELPGGRLASSDGSALSLRTARSQLSAVTFRYGLPIPGEVRIPELGFTLRALIVRSELAQEAQPADLLSLDLVGTELTVRNWCPGDRFWPAHSRSEEKLKRLFAEKRVPAGERPSWPVVLSGEEIVWVRGFPVASEYRWRGKGEAILIEVITG
jgi:tRNA(Ile)-lysidine synthase